MEKQIGSSLVTESGSYPYSYKIIGLPVGQEATLLNRGTERHPNWHFHRRIEPDGKLVKDQTRHETSEAAFVALKNEVWGLGDYISRFVELLADTSWNDL
ncbi:MAG: hypothetical protein WB421_05640 [Terriglobales bacterium]|jgi:hypothetical protein